MDETAQFWVETLAHGVLCGLICALFHELLDFIKRRIKNAKKSK